MSVAPSLFVAAVLLLSVGSPPQQTEPVFSLQTIFDLVDNDRDVRRESRELVKTRWHIALVPMILEIVHLLRPDDARWSALWSLLEEATGQKLKREVLTWFQWLWTHDYPMHPDYPVFKADLYSLVDERMAWWFKPGMKLRIRLDEVLWGGVRVDGIEPLDQPKMIEADEARYLGKKNIVFGVYLNGEARAYPKRILGWHELFNDTVGGEAVTCAYCTLCGAAVLYRGTVEDQRFDFGTSGFLYRSNKLMYDRQTHSLWSALEGKPVAGPLVDMGVELERLPIVTTTWEVWRKRHPRTKVLALETGYKKNYSEGAAYRDYYRTDELMFPVPLEDTRLKNKEEVVALLLRGRPVAYDTQFLKKNTIHHDSVAGVSVVVLTDRSGASRVYAAEEIRLTHWDQTSQCRDSQGGVWQVEEGELRGPDGRRLHRLPSHRAFWFGWYAQFPHTRLVK